MNLIHSDAPPGSQEGQEILYNLLGTNVLENVAGLCEERILFGQLRPERASGRHSFPTIPEF